MLHNFTAGGGLGPSPDVLVQEMLNGCAIRGLRILVVATALGLTAPTAALATVVGDSHDQPIVSFAINQALELERSATPIPWSNPETGRSGTIVLEPATFPQPGRPCRAYRRTIEQAGYTPGEVRGNGCRIGPALWTVDETMITPATAKAAPSPPATAPAPPTKAPAKTKAAAAPSQPRKAELPKAAADPPPAATKPSLPAYTLPSKSES